MRNQTARATIDSAMAAFLPTRLLGGKMSPVAALSVGFLAVGGCTDETDPGATTRSPPGDDSGSSSVPATDGQSPVDAGSAGPDASDPSSPPPASGDASAADAGGPGAPPRKLLKSADEADPAVEFDTEHGWLNTTTPLTLDDLRGHVTLLDFWTYGCVNCINMLPVYRDIEEHFDGEPLVAIGVHTGNFANERDPEKIEAAIEALEVNHPVLVDSTRKNWNAYGVSAWPTAVLIDAEGRVRLKQRGEFKATFMIPRVQELLDEARADGTLTSDPIEYRVDPGATSDTPLRYPMKIAILPDDRVAISDSAHHRIVVANADATLDRVIGTGERGFVDGAPEVAQLARPQGIVMHDGALFVADAENHSIRRVDITSGEVTTVAGIGKLGGSAWQVAGGWRDALTSTLRSPWDVEPIPDGLVIASAGTHQLLLLDLEGSRYRTFAGTAAESMKDGPAGEATFSQPQGLCVVGDTLYVAGAESSAIRAVNVDDGSVTTIVGHGLGRSGDTDGVGDEVFLAHVSDVEPVGPDELMLADTFNSKLKTLVPSASAVQTVDWTVGPAAVNQPQGLARKGDRLYIADTNNHRVLEHDLGTTETVVFDIVGLTAP